MAERLLIRHGQARFGADDYDALSPAGFDQARHLGQWLARQGSPPDLVVTGSLRRHRETADTCLAAAGLAAARLELPGLDEIGHEALLRRHRPDLVSAAMLRDELARQPDPQRAFQALFVAATERWIAAGDSADYPESWPAFRARVATAWDAVHRHPAAQAWVFTSGGPIGVIAAALLGLAPERSFDLAWPQVNTSLSRVRTRGAAATLVTYNAWPHLEAAGDPHLVTHR